MGDYFDNSAIKQVDEYLLSLLPDRDAVLQKMEAYALDRGFPFVGPLVGEFLQVLTRVSRANTVFELGSGFGFSAVHFARALPANGRVICTDGDEENARAAAGFLAEAGVADKVEFRVGDAVSVLQEYEGPFDIVLMDIDKQGYPDAFRAAWPKVSPGGIFIADNLLWHGRVWSDDESPATCGVRELTRLLYSTEDARTTIVPIRDGVSVTVKAT